MISLRKLLNYKNCLSIRKRLLNFVNIRKYTNLLDSVSNFHNLAFSKFTVVSTNTFRVARQFADSKETFDLVSHELLLDKMKGANSEVLVVNKWFVSALHIIHY